MISGRLFDGNPFFQGDIVLDHRTRQVLHKNPSRQRRAVKRLTKFRWPRGVIPYVISKSIGKTAIASKQTSIHTSTRFASLY